MTHYTLQDCVRCAASGRDPLYRIRDCRDCSGTGQQAVFSSFRGLAIQICDILIEGFDAAIRFHDRFRT